MIVEKRVEMKRVCANLKNVLKIVHLVFYEEGNHLVIVGAEQGCTKYQDAHKAGHALDVKAPRKHAHKIFYKLKGALGLNFTLKMLPGIWHIEFEPLLTRSLNNRTNPPSHL